MKAKRIETIMNVSFINLDFAKWSVKVLALILLTTSGAWAHSAGGHVKSLQGVGDLPASILTQPLPRSYDVGVAMWDYADAAGANNPQYQDLLNQGLAFYHVFHYLDATRSFYQAIQMQPDSILARLGLAVSIVKLGGDAESVRQSQEYFHQAQDLMNKGASIEETFWVNFTGAFLEGYLRGVSYNRLSNKSALEIFNDYSNADSDVEYLVLGTNMLTDLNAVQILQAKQNYKEALNLEPQHAGAVHYLTHLAEALNDKPGVIKYGKLIAQYSRESAHAQHMYGHNLPIEGKWVEAEKQFEIADNIHQQWAKENSVPLTYDWHYSHNLFLWGYAQVASGMDSDKATDIMVEACQTNAHHCVTLFFAVASYGYVDKLKAMIASLDSAQDVQFLEQALYWLGLEPGDSSALEASFSDPQVGLLYYINTMLVGKAAQVSQYEWDSLKSQILGQLTHTGFDSWSQVLPMVMLMRSVAVDTSNTKVQQLVDDIYSQLNFKPKY